MNDKETWKLIEEMTENGKYVSKEKACEMLGLHEFTVDYTLPQDWVDRTTEDLRSLYRKVNTRPFNFEIDVINVPKHIAGHYVWLYDKCVSTGRPYPLTQIGATWLDHLDIKYPEPK